jgi:2-keto-4-pentenoate hydratase/2-oxohepta-3-ene-1,7-dioic acid hydratase in catechol pathway
MRELDSEVGLATVLERRGQIAAFTLINDWAPRDLETREPQTSRGPLKSTDFATAIGPWLATPDELPYSNGRHLDIDLEPSGTGPVVTQGRCAAQRFTWPQMIAYAGRGTRLPPGSVPGTGTPAGGSRHATRQRTPRWWLRRGDVVTLSADGLGKLINLVNEGETRCTGS